MSSSAKLDLFIERVMRVNIMRMGGAFGGIFGFSSTESEIINNLKKSTIAFACEYSKPTPNQDELIQLSQEIYGCLQTLQLTYTLSEKEANDLIDELQMLTSNLSA